MNRAIFEHAARNLGDESFYIVYPSGRNVEDLSGLFDSLLKPLTSIFKAGEKFIKPVTSVFKSVARPVLSAFKSVAKPVYKAVKPFVPLAIGAATTYYGGGAAVSGIQRLMGGRASIVAGNGLGVIGGSDAMGQNPLSMTNPTGVLGGGFDLIGSLGSMFGGANRAMNNATRSNTRVPIPIQIPQSMIGMTPQPQQYGYGPTDFASANLSTTEPIIAQLMRQQQQITELSRLPPQPQPQAMPSWALPVGLGVGALILVMVMKK